MIDDVDVNDVGSIRFVEKAADGRIACEDEDPRVDTMLVTVLRLAFITYCTTSCSLTLYLVSGSY
jgi:hypothetical protein